MGWESFGVIRFGLGPLLQGQMRIVNLKVLITHKIIDWECFGVIVFSQA